jgi:hypothetical protein
MSSKYESILHHCKVITSKPSFKTNFFFLDEHCRMMMIDANRIVNVPFTMDFMMKKDRCWIFVDLENTLKVRVYSYNVSDESKNLFTDEAEMALPFSSLEDQILKFLSVNLPHLCEHVNPTLELEKLVKQDLCRSPYSTENNYRPRHRVEPYYQSSGSHSSYHDTSFNWNNEYREREDLLNPLYDLIKNFKTGNAIDYIDQKFPAVLQNKDKVSLVNSIFRMIAMEKLDVMTMLAIVRVSYGTDDLFFERKDFIKKVKQHLEKLRASRADRLFNSAKPPIQEEIEEEEDEQVAQTSAQTEVPTPEVETKE